MLQQLVNGLILGSVYATTSTRYTMVYGIIKLINLPTVDSIYMMGALWVISSINSPQLNF